LDIILHVILQIREVAERAEKGFFSRSGHGESGRISSFDGSGRPRTANAFLQASSSLEEAYDRDIRDLRAAAVRGWCVY
jgi:hypothetical protein